MSKKKVLTKNKVVQSIKKLVDIGPDKGYNDCNNIKDNIKENIIGGFNKMTKLRKSNCSNRRKESRCHPVFILSALPKEPGSR